MKKIILSIGTIFLFVFYSSIAKKNTTSNLAPLGSANSNSSNGIDTTSPGTSSNNSTDSNSNISPSPSNSSSGNSPTTGNISTNTAPSVSNNSAPSTTPPPSNSNNSSQGTTPQPITPKPSNNSPYKDGQYTGAVADAFYGNVQIRATIQNGKITNVQFLKYPNDRENSIEINSQAMPILTQEAIHAQSAQVDIVSGATLTSQAFIQSLTSALNQARK